MGDRTIALPVRTQGSRSLDRAVSLGALVGSDLLALGLALAFAVAVRVSVLPALSGLFQRPTYPLAHYLQLWWLPLAFLGAIVATGLYTRRVPRWEEIRRCVVASTAGALLALALVSVAKAQEDVSRPVLLLTWAGLVVTLPVLRVATKQGLFNLGPWRRRVLLVGNGEEGQTVSAALSRDPCLGYEVVEIVADWRRARERAVGVGAQDVVLLPSSGIRRDEFLHLVEDLRSVAENVLLVPDVAEVPVLGVEVLGLFEDRTILLRVPNNLLRPHTLLLKRALDLVLGSILGLLALPAVAVLAALVRLTSPGPALHVEPRVGRGGRTFRCFKLRTMYLDAESRLEAYLRTHPEARQEWERYRKLRRYDPRVTRLGRFLRRWSLDELPQLWNVLRGEMSLVGPRPYLPEEVPLLGTDGMLDVPPGMTGLWQVSGRNALDFRTREQLDRWYVGNWSLWLDLMILLRTLPAVVRGES